MNVQRTRQAEMKLIRQTRKRSDRTCTVAKEKVFNNAEDTCSAREIIPGNAIIQQTNNGFLQALCVPANAHAQMIQRRAIISLEDLWQYLWTKVAVGHDP